MLSIRKKTIGWLARLQRPERTNGEVYQTEGRDKRSRTEKRRGTGVLCPSVGT